ncbi:MULTISPECIES: HAD family hydrolase [unclassified Cryobacterium]|uniref:HAD family hydrolase n=1 Tax=unclassified Cryobacterium TaxID=2649013 RepID=UPI0034DD4D71
MGLADPPRPDAAALIAQLTRLGVRMRIATGDVVKTARAIGAQVGLGTHVCQAAARGCKRPGGLRPRHEFTADADNRLWLTDITPRPVSATLTFVSHRPGSTR